MLISDIIFKVLLHKEEGLMLIFAKSLYTAPLLDIEIVANEELEKIHAILTIVKLIDLAQEKYKAIPNEQYCPRMNKNISREIISVKGELIFPKAEDSKEFAFGLTKIF